MKRKVIKIDEEKCIGCGLCANACKEGAIALVDGKAKLVRDDHCDGLGNCLPVCPVGAISFEEREAAAFKGAAQKEEACSCGCEEDTADACSCGHDADVPETLACGCPGTHVKTIDRAPAADACSCGHDDAAEDTCSCGHDADAPETLACGCPGSNMKSIDRAQAAPAVQAGYAQSESQLSQWPVQIKLVPENAPYFSGAKLLVAADCTAYAYGDFHNKFIKGKITLVGCPKLDDVDYTEKLTAILKNNDIKSLTVVRMEVPCCGGLERAATEALKNSGKMIPWQIVTISTDGKILDE